MHRSYAILRRVFFLSVTLVLHAGADAAPATTTLSGFVTKSGAHLMLAGKEYRAIGVNIPNLSTSYNGTWHHDVQIYGSEEKARQAMVDAVTDAEQSGFKFVRFFATPGYPVDIDKLYAKDPAGYWRQMDEVVQLCGEHHLRLVPDLGFTFGCGFAPYDGEPLQAILDPGSRTYQAAHAYVRDFVTRYKDSPVILMWELQNEAMLDADVDQQGKKAVPALLFTDRKPRPPLTRADSLTWAMIQRLYREQAAFIKSLDPNHLVDSGDAAVRRECSSRRETFPNFKYRSDTFREWIGNNLLAQPEPLDVFSYHLYGAFSSDPKKNWGLSDFDWIGGLLRATEATGSPVYIGELGVEGYGGQPDPEHRWTQQFIDQAERDDVSLISLWVWHFAWQPGMTLDSGKISALVARCAEFNRKYAGEH